MDHGNMMMSPPPSPLASGTNTTMRRKKMMMHMTFFWGSKTEILFSGWPGTNRGMYALALVVVFVLAFLIEWLSHSRFLKKVSNHVVAGLVQTCMHAVRVGLAYIVMLAVMSFNGGVFFAVVAGHMLGFLLFGSSVFKKYEIGVVGGNCKSSDLPPMSC